ncbi:class I adenylate-forming enzyme family protein [Streptomyces sp. GMR22]|uniref:class I adenylate-forming enzyme family protein n=1 Tax=Streptomyces sp. GMR22 TaxID=2759524 RepID=UPI0015FD1D0A|nr:class I adenylate-forming enzyme family protein [Streptomyces sp. GMR22]MBA6439090.1 acyl--CoA ligase [Streptomyces sp. GMR22]
MTTTCHIDGTAPFEQLLDQGRIEDFLARVTVAGKPDDAAHFPEVLSDVAELRLRPGAPVLVAMPNGRELLTLVFALLATGAVPTLVPPSAPVSRIAETARRFGAGALIAPRVAAHAYGAHRTRTLGSFAEAVTLPALAPHHCRRGEVIILTSGTSGLFTGCRHGMDSLLLNARRHAAATELRETDTILVNLPLHYSYALVAQAFAALVRGSRLVVSGPPFTHRSYRAEIEEHAVTVSSLTPTLVSALSRDGGLALPCPLRTLTVGGDALDSAYVERLLAANPGLELYVTYGLTEAGPRVATLAAHREPAHRHASVGLPLPGVRTWLRKQAPDDSCGELIVETDTALRGRVGTGDGPAPAPGGRIATGDLFEEDEGYLYFRGRLAEFIVVRGEKVSLRSVRKTVESLPGVVRANTRVYRNDDGELRFDLEVYLHDPDSLRPDEIRRRLNDRLLRGERPSGIAIYPVPETGWHK